MHRMVLAGLMSAVSIVPAFALVARAQEAPVVTEAEFLSVLDGAHPAVREASEATAVARAQVLAASTLENPVLGAVREDPSGIVEQVDWTLSWQLPHPGRRSRIAAREDAVVAASARRTFELVSLRLEMQEVYADWAFASERRDRFRALAGRAAALAERERLRAEKGEASGLEAHRLGLSAQGLEARAALAAADAEEARGRAASWSPDLPPAARPVPPPLPPLPPAPGGRGDIPSVLAAEKELDAARREQEAARRFVLSPEILVGWQRQEAGPESLSGPLFGLAWSVPVFDRHRAGRADSHARLAGSRARLERVRREVAAGRAAARTTYRDLVAALRSAEEALAGNERMLEGIEASFRHGEASLTDLLDTQRSIIDSELAVLDLYEAALRAHRELSRLHPSPPEPDSQEDLP